MISKKDIGNEISIKGDKFIVLDFTEQTCVDDFGHGPVWQKYSASLEDIKTGEVITIEWED